MKWFGKIPAIKYTDYYKLTDVQPDKFTDEVTDWEFIERVGHIMDDYSYCVFKHLPTNKLYKTCWGTLDPNGKCRPTGRYDPNTDYKVLCEVVAEQKTVYKTIRN